MRLEFLPDHEIYHMHDVDDGVMLEATGKGVLHCV